MSLAHLLSSNVIKASVATGLVATVQNAATRGTIEVGPSLYTLIAALLGLIGVYLARLVTIDAENKKLGRIQTLRETGPLTWIGVLIVCPFIWHFDIAVPWASMIGLGVGYSVRIVLKIFGGGAVNAARILARRAADALENDAADAAATREDIPPAVLLPPDHEGSDGPARLRLLAKLDDVPDVILPVARDGKGLPE